MAGRHCRWREHLSEGLEFTGLLHKSGSDLRPKGGQAMSPLSLALIFACHLGFIFQDPMVTPDLIQLCDPTGKRDFPVSPSYKDARCQPLWEGGWGPLARVRGLAGEREATATTTSLILLPINSLYENIFSVTTHIYKIYEFSLVYIMV